MILYRLLFFLTGLVWRASGISVNRFFKSRKYYVPCASAFHCSAFAVFNNLILLCDLYNLYQNELSVHSINKKINN